MIDNPALLTTDNENSFNFMRIKKNVKKEKNC